MKIYTNDISLKPKLKKCESCGAYGQPNRSCRYWVNDQMTEWGCSNPKIQKKEDKSE